MNPSIMKKILLLGAIGLFSVGVSADANAQVIVDNSDPGFSAPIGWGTGSGGSQFGPDYRFAFTGQGIGPAVWKARLPAGIYKISAWWVSGANRPPAAPYIISHAGGSTTVLKNQQTGGGAWQTLGAFSLNAGVNQVQLSTWTSSGYVVIADAIRWQP